MAAGSPDLVLESVGTVAFTVSGGGPVDRGRGRGRAAAAGDPVLLVAAADPGPGMTAGQEGP